MKQAISQGELKSFALDSSSPPKAPMILADVCRAPLCTAPCERWGSLYCIPWNLIPQPILLILSLNDPSQMHLQASSVTPHILFIQINTSLWGTFCVSVIMSVTGDIKCLSQDYENFWICQSHSQIFIDQSLVTELMNGQLRYFLVRANTLQHGFLNLVVCWNHLGN